MYLIIRKKIMDTSSIIYIFAVLTLMLTTADGQINRYINPAWLEMDANSEYYAGGEVISRILQDYGFGNGYGPSRYRSSILDHRNGYGRSYPRNRIVNDLNNVYDSDPLTQEYYDRNYDYTDNTIRGTDLYRNTVLDVPRRSRINTVSTVPKTVYYQSEYLDRDLPYSRSGTVTGSPVTSRELLLRDRELARLIPRSTVVTPTTDLNEKRNM